MSAVARNVERYWEKQLALMRSLPAAVAARDPDAVHDLRAAGRRLRATIAAFTPLERRRLSGRVAGELAWYNDILGAARDAEVACEQVAELTGDADLTAGLTARRRLTVERADEMLASHRASGLLDALDVFAADPWRASVARSGRGPSDKRMRARIAWSQRRVGRAWATVEAVDGSAAAASAEHRLRRRAKAARYVLEAVGDAVPGADESAGRYADLASLLGVLQDTVVVERALACVCPHGRSIRAEAVRLEQIRRADEARSGLSAAVRAALRDGVGR